MQNASILFELFDGNEMLRARLRALRARIFCGKQKNLMKIILQNHIIIELDDLSYVTR